MKAEIGKEIFYLTWRFIIDFLIYLASIASRGAAGVSRAPSRAQLLENSCKISSQARPWWRGCPRWRGCPHPRLSANFRPHNDPSPVRIVLTQTPFFLIQTPSALIQTRFALTTTPFALTPTLTVPPLEKVVSSQQAVVRFRKIRPPIPPTL